MNVQRIPRILRFLLWTGCLILASAKSGSVADGPFKIGERLVYSVEWDPPWYLFFLPKMEAGEVELHHMGDTEYNGKNALKISFKAHSSGTLAKLAGLKIDDDFTFLSDPATFCSLKAAKRIQEGKRNRRINIEYLRESGKLRIHEEDLSINPPKLLRDEVKNNVPECVQDPFSAVYYLRMMKLQTGYVHSAMIGYDDRVKEVIARVEDTENVNTPAGKFSAWRITTSALMGGLFKSGGQFKLWLSADEQTIPVQFEVKVSLGRAIGKLRRLP